NHLIQAWKDNGLPPSVPFYMTEGNDLEDGGPETVKRGLWLADYVGSMLTAGASGTYYFHYIASTHGNDGFLSVDGNNRVISYSPQYLATQVITKEWVQPVDSIHKLYKAASDVKDDKGNILVTAYPVQRPDGKWSILLVNKDKDHDHTVKVRFADAADNDDRFFTGSVDRIVFGPGEYVWHADAPATANDGGENGRRRQVRTGHAAPDGPPSKSAVTSGGPETVYELPRASIVVLRGELTGGR
ncbi:MAG: hypothetical protein JO061_19710, partial [Acidobacteriaceae bacterium]|nr:hypothetical protein [Acidobacteriaceae bacterium]